MLKLALAALLAATALGRSEGGRPIVLVRAGDPHATRVLVVGCVHGNECAGLAVTRALARVREGADLWLVPNLNPDGYARRTRQNGRGVDLNRNWPTRWHRRPGSVFYGGTRPFSERETRIARNLIQRIRPRVTIWYHQRLNLVWAWRQSADEGLVYARASGQRLYRHRPPGGSASGWQDTHFEDSASFAVELPAGSLTPQQVRRHVNAVLSVASGTRR